MTFVFVLITIFAVWAADVAAFAYRTIHIRDGQVENDVRRAA